MQEQEGKEEGEQRQVGMFMRDITREAVLNSASQNKHGGEVSGGTRKLSLGFSLLLSLLC